MSCWARNGTDCMFVSTNQGLRSLADNEQVLLEALDVMDGDLTCCRLGHARGEPCDREELMLPMLGLYTEIYRGRHGERAEAYAFVEPIKDKLYPRSFTYTYKDADGVVKSEESVLFGDLVKAAELAVDLSVADPDDPLWRSGLPDLAPGTDAPERSHHLRTNHTITAVHSRSMTLKRSLSTLVSPVPSDVMRMPPRRLRSEYSTTSNRSEDGISPLPPSARPDRGGRPQLLRSMTWRASAPTLPGLDDDSDGGDGMDV